MKLNLGPEGPIFRTVLRDDRSTRFGAIRLIEIIDGMILPTLWAPTSGIVFRGIVLKDRACREQCPERIGVQRRGKRERIRPLTVDKMKSRKHRDPGKHPHRSQYLRQRSQMGMADQMDPGSFQIAGREGGQNPFPLGEKRGQDSPCPFHNQRKGFRPVPDLPADPDGIDGHPGPGGRSHRIDRLRKYIEAFRTKVRNARQDSAPGGVAVWCTRISPGQHGFQIKGKLPGPCSPSDKKCRDNCLANPRVRTEDQIKHGQGRYARLLPKSQGLLQPLTLPEPGRSPEESDSSGSTPPDTVAGSALPASPEFPSKRHSSPST